MPIQIEVDDHRLVARVDAIPPAVRSGLLSAADAIQSALASKARANAEAHIHFQGKKPGQYLDSIRGGVSDKPDAIIGYVRSGDPLAHLLESGAQTPPHTILPSAARVLAFTFGYPGSAAGFAKAVRHPGATIPPYPAIGPAFEDMKDEIRARLEDAAKGAAKAQ